MYFSTNLKYLRERKCEMQKDVADLLGISKPSMGRYESGECEPDIAKLIKLADHFEITIDELIRKDLRPPLPRYAQNINILRNQYQCSQDDLAKLLNVNQSTISLYETGKRKMEVEDLLIVAEYFGVTLDQLVKQDLKEGII